MRTFDELQAGLGPAMAANGPGSEVPHVVLAFPSHSVGEALLSHYGDRVLALEHRFLLSTLMTHRLPAAQLVYVSSLAPTPLVVDYYRRLGPRPDLFTEHAHVLAVEDRSPRSMAAKLLDRPDVLDRLRRLVDGRPAVIEPWNVTELEVTVAEALQVPVNGLDPRLRHLGFKSAGRRLFRSAGVQLPEGAEDVRTVADVVDAVAAIRAARPALRAVVVKHDDSGAGDGNVVLDLAPAVDGLAPGELDRSRTRALAAALPGWYLDDLRGGGVVEELLTAARVTSPSVQIDLQADGQVRVLATHEQVLGGESGQVFLGCRLPAAPDYAARLAQHARAVGERLAQSGVVGRASIDFMAVADDDGRWTVFALEVNLRKGGTTHPYAALRNLVPGRYDEDAGCWLAAADGMPRAYVCTDNLVDPTWVGLPESTVVDAVGAAGLELDHRTGTGVVLHMLAGLGIDGRFGLTAIATDPAAAQEMFDRTRDVVAAAAARFPAPRDRTSDVGVGP